MKKSKRTLAFVLVITIVLALVPAGANMKFEEKFNLYGLEWGMDETKVDEQLIAAGWLGVIPDKQMFMNTKAIYYGKELAGFSQEKTVFTPYCHKLFGLYQCTMFLYFHENDVDSKQEKDNRFYNTILEIAYTHGYPDVLKEIKEDDDGWEKLSVWKLKDGTIIRVELLKDSVYMGFISPIQETVNKFTQLEFKAK